MTIPAAGTVPWRVVDGVLEVALVHRPAYNDWSWPKGKLDPGESAVVAAVRETLEEADYLVEVGVPLPEARYLVLDRSMRKREKTVEYWAARVVGGGGALVNEIDEVAWLPVQAAHDRLDYARDQEQLLALVRFHQAGHLNTWPLVLVRHADAISRSDFGGPDDRDRPLSDKGATQAEALVPIIGAYGIRRIVSSRSARCAQTIEPTAAALDVGVRWKKSLSEEGFEANPAAAITQADKAIARGTATVLCSHGPVLPALIDVIERHAPEGEAAARTLADARERGMKKGEALVAHVSGTGDAARIIAVERQVPATTPPRG